MSGIIIDADLEGKINNIPSFKKEALLPLFEAIVNSIHAIEDRKNSENGIITVNIIRKDEFETSLDEFHNGETPNRSNHERKIVAFEIEDNGIGFNRDNYKSFKTADSTYKISRGGKGVGRFLWLKAFDKVEIESIYEENKIKYLRRIEFSKKQWVVEKCNNAVKSDELKTRVRLIGFKEEYRREHSAYKKTRKIAQRILEHCLSYYINGAVPKIIVTDGGESYNLDTLYEKIKKDSHSESISLYGNQFLINHLKLFDTNDNVHNIVFCADKREVETYPISSLLGTSALYETGDDGDKFYYSAYVSSAYLDRCVDTTRSFFYLPTEGNQHIDGSVTVSLKVIKDSVLERTKAYLATYLESLSEKKKDRISTFVSSYPALRSVPLHCPEIYNEIEPNSSDEKIYEVLYKHKGVAELSIQEKTKKFLKKQSQSIEDAQREYEDLSRTIEDFKKDELVSYICKRKMIIDLLDTKLQLGDTGKYALEAEIHDIIFPRKCNTDDISYENHNLWIINEQLTFHQFAVSDLELKKISSSDSLKRPDIIVFSEIGEDRIARSISIIELKRPQREEFDIDPIAQMYEIIRSLQKKEVKLPNGRRLLVGEPTKFFCYALCDINEKIITFAENSDFRELKDGLGYYSYNSKLNAYTEIIAFDRLITDVKKRHQIFFQKLGIKDL